MQQQISITDLLALDEIKAIAVVLITAWLCTDAIKHSLRRIGFLEKHDHYRTRVIAFVCAFLATLAVWPATSSIDMVLAGLILGLANPTLYLITLFFLDKWFPGLATWMRWKKPGK